MHWIYLSPHLDDVALSLGGLLWQQSQAGARVSIWTICAGDPPPGPLSPFAQSLHARWGVGRQAIATRRAEDAEACRILGADYRHFSLPDCIYRRSPQHGQSLYASEQAIFGAVHPDEDARRHWVTRTLREQLPARARLIIPWGLGGHVDHRLTRAAAQQLEHPLGYYADYPYVLAEADWNAGGLTPAEYPISKAALTAWQRAVAAHHSQISTFWNNLDEMRAALQVYAEGQHGAVVWLPK